MEKIVNKEHESWMIQELTKAKVAHWEKEREGLSTEGIWWVQAYHEAENEIKEAEKAHARTKPTL